MAAHPIVAKRDHVVQRLGWKYHGTVFGQRPIRPIRGRWMPSKPGPKITGPQLGAFDGVLIDGIYADVNGPEARKTEHLNPLLLKRVSTARTLFHDDID